MIEHLVADVLDVQIVDKHFKNAGRVDGIVLTWSANTRPLVSFVEIGPVTLLARINRRLAEWYARRDRAFGPARGKPFRVAWDHIREEKRSLRLDVDTEETPINALEDYLRQQIIERVLGR